MHLSSVVYQRNWGDDRGFARQRSCLSSSQTLIGLSSRNTVGYISSRLIRLRPPLRTTAFAMTTHLHSPANPVNTRSPRPFTLQDADACYRLAEAGTPLGDKVKDALGVIDKAVEDYGCVARAGNAVRVAKRKQADAWVGLALGWSMLH